MLSGIIWALVVLLLIAWLLGLFVFNVGSIIHLLLILVIIGVLFNLLNPHNTVV